MLRGDVRVTRRRVQAIESEISSQVTSLREDLVEQTRIQRRLLEELQLARSELRSHDDDAHTIERAVENAIKEAEGRLGSELQGTQAETTQVVGSVAEELSRAISSVRQDVERLRRSIEESVEDLTITTARAEELFSRSRHVSTELSHTVGEVRSNVDRLVEVAATVVAHMERRDRSVQIELVELLAAALDEALPGQNPRQTRKLRRVLLHKLEETPPPRPPAWTMQLAASSERPVVAESPRAGESSADASADLDASSDPGVARDSTRDASREGSGDRDTSAHVCEICGFEAKTRAGLSSHVRSH